MRPLSPNGLRAVLAPATDDVFVPLLEIDHPSLAAPIRVAGCTENVTSNGNLYIGYQFEVALPTDKRGEPPRAEVTIDNVDRQIVEALDALEGPPTVTIRVVRLSEPDVIEYEAPGLLMFRASADIGKVTGHLSLIDERVEPYPCGTFAPGRFPGGFISR